MFYDIIDFKAIVKHSYYASKPSYTLTCEDTGEEVTPWQEATNTIVDMYFNLLTDFRHTLVAMDMGTDYRTAFFPNYKKNRSKKKEEQSPLEKEQLELFTQWCKKMLISLGCTLVGVEGVEADDVIAWLTQGEDIQSIVHTVDGDLVQLATENCAIKLRDGIYQGNDCEYKGTPARFTSIKKSLVGDSGDGYKGVPGFGKAAFSKLMETIGPDGMQELERVIDSRDYDTLKEASDSWEDSKELKKILDNWDTWTTQWRLAKLHPELCWKPRGGKLTQPIFFKRIPNESKFTALIEEVGMEDVVFNIEFPNIMSIDGNEIDGMMGSIKEGILEGSLVAYDYETTDFNQVESFKKASNNPDFVDVLSQTLTGVSFAFGKYLEDVIYIPVDHKDTNNVNKERIKEILEFVGKNDVQLVAQNYSFEGVVNRTNLDLVLDGVHDTKIMKRYVDENSPSGLKWMSKNYLGYTQATYEETISKAKTEDNPHPRMCDLTLEQVLKYGADDSLVTGHLYDLLALRLQLEHQWKHYTEWCVEPTQMFQSAYIEGVKLDEDLQKKLQGDDEQSIIDNMEKLREVLNNNVTGEITKGCKSYIDCETEYMTKKFQAKAKSEGKKSEYWKEKLSQWKKKVREQCTYIPLEEYKSYPEFKYTARNVGRIAEKVNLPKIEKLTLTYLSNYLDEIGMTDASAPDLDEKQMEVAELVQESLAERLDKYNKDPTFARQQLMEKWQGLVERYEEPKIAKIGDELNVGSSDQMKGLIYCKIGVPVRLFGTNLGEGRKKLDIFNAAPATDEDAIKFALANDVEKGSWQEEALQLLLKIKAATTRLDLFHKKLPLWVHLDGKIHPSITDSGTVTRRPTASSPNVLQIPGHGPASVMRSMYMSPKDDYVCVGIDYSGQELRIIANESHDKNMLLAYDPDNERDIHSMTGIGIVERRMCSDQLLKVIKDYDEFNKARKDSSHEMHEQADSIRGEAKACNFLLTYLGTYPTLSRNLSLPPEEARELLESAMSMYEGVGTWQNKVSEFMKKNGYTETAFGTRRHATDMLFSNEKGLVKRMMRQGVNATVQGCAAEILKRTLTTMWKTKLSEKVRMVFAFPVYDEVVSFVHKDDVVHYWKEMKRIMTGATPDSHTIKQVPELSVGHTWGSMKELGRNPKEEQILEVLNGI